MEKFSIQQYNKVKRWMYRNARPVDLARWQYHFENGNKEAVIKALTAYQNDDGGFAYALEEDSWNPESSPAQTSTAIEILFEIGVDENCQSVLDGTLKYLQSGAYVKNGFWLPDIPSNKDYPHAFWWDYDENKSYDYLYNPTAILSGFILAYGEAESELYQKAYIIATQAVQKFIAGDLPTDKHELVCFAHLLMGIEKSSILDRFDIDSFSEKIRTEITKLLSDDPVMVEGRYAFNSPDSPFYEANKEYVKLKLDYIINNTNSDGVWDIDWQWNAYDKEYAISENWWKGTMVLRNMLFLRNFNMLSFE